MRRTLLIPAAIGAAFCNLPVAADQNEVDEIIVSAARVGIARADVGNAVTVIDRDMIEARRAREVTDLLRSVPGFAVSRSGVNGSQTQVRVRGSEANHVLVLIDGNRANDPASGDEFRWEYLSTANIERIEIVRGAQSVLWGSDAIGGVVNIITRRADRQPAAGGFVEAGSFNTLNVGANGAVASDHWSLAGGVERQHTDGENVSQAGSEDDGATLNTAYLTTTLRASERWSLDASLRFIDARSDFDDTDFSIGIPADSDSVGETDTFSAQVNAMRESADGRFGHRFSARLFDTDNRNFLAGESTGVTAAERLTLGYQFDLTLGDNGLTLATEHERSDFSQRGPVIFGDPNQDQSIDILSLIAEYRWLAGDRLSWIASARHDSNSDFDNALHGRLSAAYRLTDTLKLRANIGSGRKNPTFIERFGFFPGQFIGNASLKPERSLTYEIGLDGEARRGDLQWQVTAFRQTLEDEINGFAFDSETFLFTAENQSGRSERRGLELAGQWSLPASLSATATYSYIDATEEDASGQIIDELRRPRHAGSLSLSQRALEGRLTNFLTAEYGGSRDDRFFPPFPQPSRIVSIGNYWLIGLTSEYAFNEQVSVYLRGSNLLDERYEEVYGYRTLGRAAYIGASMNFGR